MFVRVAIFFLFFAYALCTDPTIVSRDQWGARKAKEIKALKINPPTYAIIHHSVTSSCTTTEKCKEIVKGIQTFHMDNMKWLDIGYNFLIGGDGLVYEGRGFNKHGSHMPGYNSKSLGICLLGNFEESTPTTEQLDATQNFITYAANKGYLSSDYKLLGHRQGIATLCPGKNLYEKITHWTHWTNNI